VLINYLNKEIAESTTKSGLTSLQQSIQECSALETLGVFSFWKSPKQNLLAAIQDKIAIFQQESIELNEVNGLRMKT